MTPPYTGHERLGKWSLLGGTLPSVSLLYLATSIRRICHVKVVDASCLDYSEQQILDEIVLFRPAIIGISAVTPSISRAQNIARQIKNRQSEVLIVLGGPHVTTAPVKTMQQTPAIDIGVIGEGELTLREIIERFDGSLESVSSIRGTIVRSASDGSIIRNDPRDLIRNIDEIGLPAYDMIPAIDRIRPAVFKTKRLPAIHAITSRGCAHNCTFCNTNIFNKKVRYHSSKYVINLIEYLMKAGFREISFEDDNFTAYKVRLREICRYLIDNRIDLSWSVNARIDTVDRDTLKLMKDAGCWYISYGIESGDQDTLNRVNKKLTLDQIRTIISMTREIGIEAKGFFIVGFPWETRETVKRTIDFAKSLHLSDLNIFPLTPFPGTDIYDEAKRSGDFDDDWRQMDLQHIVYVPENLTREFISKSINQLLLSFYFRPLIIFNYIARLFKSHRVFRKILIDFSKTFVFLEKK